MAIPPLPSPGVVLVSFRGNCNGQRIMTTYHYRLAVPPSGAVDYVSALDALYLKLNAVTGMIASYLSCMASNYTLEVVRIQPVYPTRLRYREYSQLASGTWAGGDVTSNQNLACSIKRVSTLIGRKGVGRIQLVMPDGQSAGGFVVNVNTYVDTVNQHGAFMIQPIVTAGVVATWNPCLADGPSDVAGTNDLEQYTVEDTVRTMHRRTVGLGE